MWIISSRKHIPRKIREYMHDCAYTRLYVTSSIFRNLYVCEREQRVREKERECKTIKERAKQIASLSLVELVK